MLNYKKINSHGNSVGIKIYNRLDSRGSVPGRGKIFLFSTASRLTLRLSQLYPIGTDGVFSGRLSGRGMKLITHLHLVPRSRMMELYFHSAALSWTGA
jgi:hypothetical protein